METNIKEPKVLLERLVIRSPYEFDSRQKFINLTDSILKRTGVEQLGDCIVRDIDHDLFITIEELTELKLLSGELNICNIMQTVNEILLKDLLNVLERNIRLGCGKSEFSSSSEMVCHDEEQYDQLTHDLTMQAMKAVFTVLNILTSDNIPTNIYIEFVINRILQFITHQLEFTIFPAFDPFYRQNLYAQNHSKKEKNNIKILYRNLLEAIELFSKMIELKPLPEKTIYLIATLSSKILIVDNVEELYSSAIKIIGKVFEKHESSKSQISRVLSLIILVSESKHEKRSYKINPTFKVTTVTALILELIQSYFILPTDLATKVKFKKTVQEKYDVAISVAQDFILTFFYASVERKGETNCKKRFKNFIEDLLVLVDRPEWPASEMMLFLLCNLFVSVLKGKQANVQCRTMCLEYLGLIISTMHRNKKEAQSKLSEMSKLTEIYKERDIFENMNKKFCTLPIEVQRKQLLQYIVIHYLKHGQHMDYCISDPTNYNVVIWYKEIEDRIKSKRSSEKYKKKSKYSDIPGEEKNSPKSSDQLEKMFLKTALFSIGRVVCPITKRPVVEYDDMKLICKYLNSMRYFSNSYQFYLKHMFCALSDSSNQVQSTAMKSIAMVIDTEPGLLNDIELGTFVNYSLSHTSISVREAALNLIGKYFVRQPGIVDKYHDVLISSVLDSAKSVRKRAIRILKEICLTNTKFSKISEVCKVMVDCVSDEGIKIMILQFFHELWFTKFEKEVLMDKVVSILNVVGNFESSHFQKFGVLLQMLLNSNEGINSKEASLSCQRITNAIINIIVNDEKQEETLMDISDNDKEKELTKNNVTCFAVLAVISKIDPQLLVPHAISLQPFLYFGVKKEITEISKIISSALQIMEAIVPVIEHPGDLFVAKIEEACINIILLQNGDLMKPAFSCLSVIINKVTQNYKLITDLVIKFLKHTMYFMACDLKNSKHELFNTHQHYLRRCLLLLGFSFQYFDLSDKVVTKDEYDYLKKNTFQVLLYFSKHIEADVTKVALRSLGSFCIRYSSCMLLPETNELYQNILSSQVVHFHITLQVLCTFQNYLKDVEHQLVFQHGKSKKKSERGSLKQLGEEWSEITVKIFELYIENILAAYKYSNCQVRYGVFQIIQMLISQGILNPVNFVPHLICAATEDVHVFKQTAETELRKVILKHPYAMKCMAVKGILLSQEVHCLVEEKKVPRGVNQNNIAVNYVIYDIIQSTRNSRHNFIKNIIQLFNKEDMSIQKLIYVCDNLASFTYQIQDEVLFLIYQVDIIINVNGNSILLCFEEALIPAGNNRKQNLESLLKRIPESFETLRDCITSSERYELLLLLRQYIKKAYNIDDIKLIKYKPSEPLSMYDKPIRRNMLYKFNPESVLCRLSTNDYLPESNEKKNLAMRYLQFKNLMQDELQDSDVSLSDEETMNSRTYAEGNKQNIKRVDSTSKKRQRTNIAPPNKRKRTS